MTIFPANSQILQKKEGYRELFTLFSLLQLVTRYDFLKTDFNELIENKDVPTLYEYWCFFQIKSIMDLMFKVKSVNIIINSSPVQHTLSQGLCIEYEKKITLCFNKSWQGSRGITPPEKFSDIYKAGISYSHTFRPDIVIENQHEKLVFDAKYKGTRPGFYCEGEDGPIDVWKNQDIDKMHTYRKGITGVAGSFILYPGKQSIVYPAHDARDIVHGVGALALRPGDRDNHNAVAHIKHLISVFVNHE